MPMTDPTMSPVECEADVRKRVCKACDRCRIKKSKCDGKKPCSRCRNDDAICVFGGRKKKTDRVHPKGYVEILERQQKQLVKGIRAIYDRQLSGQSWDGPFPNNGYPPTHEILDFLGALDIEGSSDEDEDEESCQFEDSLHELRRSVTGKMSTKSGPIFRQQSPGISKQHELLPNQRPGQYFGKTHHNHSADDTDSSRRSPDSLTTSKTSPSTSVDSQRWSTSLWLEQSQRTWPENGRSLMTEGLVDCDIEMLESPMQDAFSDPFLAAPWDADEDICRLSYS